jgi:CRP-like cAMP-binding protein
VLGILAELEFFSNVDYESLTKLSALFDERIFEFNDIIFDEGSLGQSMLVIISGEVRITQISNNSSEEALIILKKGDLFGEMALIEEMPRSATAIAHKNCVILEIKREKFVNFINKNPSIGLKILWKLTKTLSSRLRETDNKLKTFINLSQWL